MRFLFVLFLLTLAGRISFGQHLSLAEIEQIRQSGSEMRKKILQANGFVFVNNLSDETVNCEKFNRTQTDDEGYFTNESFSFCDNSSTYITYDNDQHRKLKAQLVYEKKYKDTGITTTKEGYFKTTLVHNHEQVEIISVKNSGGTAWLFYFTGNQPSSVAEKEPDNQTVPAVEAPVVTRGTKPVAAAGPVSLSGKYYALVIAVKDYVDKSLNLQNPVKDAQELISMLTSNYSFQPSDITFLKNPTREQILIAFELLGSKLTPEDNVLIFFAGHGKWNDRINQGYWLPADARMSSTVGLISNSEIKDQIHSLNNRHTLLISDACFSGTFLTRSAENQPVSAINQPDRAILNSYNKKSRTAITSANKTVVSDNSVFIHYLLVSLKKNQHKYLSVFDLFSDIRTPVMVNSPTGQEPLFGPIRETGHEGGGFIFIRK